MHGYAKNNLNYMKIIDDFINLLKLKRYSENTIETYKNVLVQTYNFFKKPFKDITDKDLWVFISHFVNEKNISSSYQRQIIGALKLFYLEIYKREISVNYLQVKQREKVVPVVLSIKEVNSIINALHNIKHRAIITLVYSSGLRIGELINLKKSDIDSERMTVYIKGGKGKKDRYTVLSQKALELLRLYYLQYKPRDFLFEGQNGGKYSSESCGQFFREAIIRAGIKKKVTLHSLRHSFATHLLEHGVSITHIQKLLGHSNINTTLIYTHITDVSIRNIKSPLDL